MFERLRKFFATSAGQATGIGIGILFVIVAIIVVKLELSDTGKNLATDRMFVDSTTNQPFPHELLVGETVPVAAPSGGKTGYPSEKCYWNKDGTIKKDPTYVILNGMLGKSEPTFCPDCGRLVVGNNPMASPDRKPPMTQAEWTARGMVYREPR